MPCTKGPGTNGGAGHLEDHERAHTGAPGSQADHGPIKAYVDKHPDFNEYKVHTGGRGSRGYYTDDREDAIATAKAIHGAGATIVHRSKRYGPEPDQGNEEERLARGRY